MGRSGQAISILRRKYLTSSSQSLISIGRGRHVHRHGRTGFKGHPTSTPAPHPTNTTQQMYARAPYTHTCQDAEMHTYTAAKQRATHTHKAPDPQRHTHTTNTHTTKHTHAQQHHTHLSDAGGTGGEEGEGGRVRRSDGGAGDLVVHAAPTPMSLTHQYALHMPFVCACLRLRLRVRAGAGVGVVWACMWHMRVQVMCARVHVE